MAPCQHAPAPGTPHAPIPRTGTPGPAGELAGRPSGLCSPWPSRSCHLARKHRGGPRLSLRVGFPFETPGPPWQPAPGPRPARLSPAAPGCLNKAGRAAPRASCRPLPPPRPEEAQAGWGASQCWRPRGSRPPAPAQGLAVSPADRSRGTRPGGPVSSPQPLGLRKALDPPRTCLTCFKLKLKLGGSGWKALLSHVRSSGALQGCRLPSSPAVPRCPRTAVPQCDCPVPPGPAGPSP